MRVKIKTPMDEQAAGMSRKELEAIGEDNRLVDIFLKPEINDVLSKLRKTYEDTLNIFSKLKSRITKIDVTESELGFHEMFLQEVESLSTEMKSKANALREKNGVRMFRFIIPKGTDGFMAFDKQFVVDAQLIPGAPSKIDTPEKYDEFMKFIEASEYSGIINVVVPWQSLKTMCEELATQGKPGPPHVKQYPKPKIKIKAIKK